VVATDLVYLTAQHRERGGHDGRGFGRRQIYDDPSFPILNDRSLIPNPVLATVETFTIYLIISLNPEALLMRRAIAVCVHGHRHAAQRGF